MSTVRAFMERHYLHYNARETLAAAKAWEAHVEAGGKMMVTLAGAMSTARIGRILGRLIKKTAASRPASATSPSSGSARS
jgi:deoxyhypusine synthase